MADYNINIPYRTWKKTPDVAYEDVLKELHTV